MLLTYIVIALTVLLGLFSVGRDFPYTPLYALLALGGLSLSYYQFRTKRLPFLNVIANIALVILTVRAIAPFFQAVRKQDMFLFLVETWIYFLIIQTAVIYAKRHYYIIQALALGLLIYACFFAANNPLNLLGYIVSFLICWIMGLRMIGFLPEHKDERSVVSGAADLYREFKLGSLIFLVALLVSLPFYFIFPRANIPLLPPDLEKLLHQRYSAIYADFPKRGLVKFLNKTPKDIYTNPTHPLPGKTPMPGKENAQDYQIQASPEVKKPEFWHAIEGLREKIEKLKQDILAMGDEHKILEMHSEVHSWDKQLDQQLSLERKDEELNQKFDKEKAEYMKQAAAGAESDQQKQQMQEQAQQLQQQAQELQQQAQQLQQQAEQTVQAQQARQLQQQAQELQQQAQQLQQQAQQQEQAGQAQQAQQLQQQAQELQQQAQQLQQQAQQQGQTAQAQQAQQLQQQAQQLQQQAQQLQQQAQSSQQQLENQMQADVQTRKDVAKQLGTVEDAKNEIRQNVYEQAKQATQQLRVLWDRKDELEQQLMGMLKKVPEAQAKALEQQGTEQKQKPQPPPEEPKKDEEKESKNKAPKKPITILDIILWGLLSLLVAYLLGMLLIFLVPFIRQKSRYQLAVERKQYNLAIALLYNYLSRLLGLVGLQYPVVVLPEQYQVQLASKYPGVKEQAGQFTGLFIEARYSFHALGEEQLTQALAHYQTILQEARENSPYIFNQLLSLPFLSNP